jgi:hypothetical protein
MADPLDEIIDRRLGTAPPEPAAAPANDGALDAIIDRRLDAQRQREGGAILSAAEHDPDQRAQALSLGAEMGLPADTVERNKDVVEREAKLKRLRAALDDAPALAKLIDEDPEFLTLAQDDAALLKLASPGLGTQTADVARAAPGGLVQGLGMGVKGLGELYEVAGRSLARPVEAGMEAIGLGDLRESMRTALPWWLAPQEILKRPGAQLKLAGEAIAPPEERQTVATDISGAVGQMAGQIGMALVNPTAAVAMMIGQGGDIQAERVEQSGKAGTVEGDTAIVMGAAITGLTEKYGLDMILNRVPPQIKNRILRQLTDIAIGGGIEAAQEVTEGILQNLTTQQLVNPDQQILEGLERDAIAAGGAGVIMRSLVNAATRGRSVQSQAQAGDQAQANAENLTKAVEAANESTLLTRDKARFEAAVNAMSGDAEVFIPAEPLREFFQSLPTDEAGALAQELGIDDQMADALDRGGDVVIPVAKYLSTLKDHHAALLPHVRLEQGGATLKEAEAFNAEVGTVLREQADELAAETEQDRAGLAPVERVREDVFTQLRLAGQTIDVAERNAGLWAARYATRAERLGRDAWDLYQESPLQVNRPVPDALANRVDELDMMIERLKSGKRESDTQVKGLNLWEFIAAEGGVEDAGGELKAMDLDKRKVKVGRASKPIVRKGGADKRQQGMAGMGATSPREASIEEMARKAADAGYLPELKRQMEDPDAPVPDYIGAFLEAIRDGDRVFSETARDTAAEEMRQAIDYLGEELDHLGIDVRTASREDIKAAINAKFESQAEQDGRTFKQMPETVTVKGAERPFTDSRNLPIAHTRPVQEAFWKWFDGSQVVDAQGRPLVVFHGTNKRFDEFKRQSAMRRDGNATFETEAQAFFFSIDRDTAAAFAADRVQVDKQLRGKSGGRATVGEFYLSVQNPLDFVITDDVRAQMSEDGFSPLFNLNAPSPYAASVIAEITGAEPQTWQEVQAALDDPEVITGLRDRGYDGVRLVEDDGSESWAAFEPTQIKSLDNTGSFSPNDPRILYQAARGGGHVIGGIRYAVKPPRKLYRGVVEGQQESGESGLGITNLGRGLYSSPSKSFAKMYATNGRVHEVPIEAGWPRNPLVLRGVGGAEGLLLDHVFRNTDFKNAREFNAAYPDRAEFVKSLGFDGVIAGDEVVRYPDVAGERIVYQPDGGAGPRGSAQFLSDGGRIINLFEKADLSTFLHETGHVFLEEMAADAARADAPDQVRADFQTLLDWFGVEAWADVTVEHHEQFARGFEAYLFKGEAPSLGLRDAFRRFAAWLQTLYRSVRSLRVNVTPEISAVMDRMLATDAEIAIAEREMRFKPLFADAKTAGLTDAEFRAYAKLADRATTEAKESLQKKLMAEVTREKTKWWQEERKRTRTEAAEIVDAEPAQQALASLQEKDGPRLSKPAVSAVYGGPEVVRLLPRGITVAEGGIHPDDMADSFGFKSGKQLLDALLNAPRRDVAIEVETDRLMRERHGDMLNDGSLPNEAIDSAQNLERGKAIAAELRILRKMQRVHNDVARAERAKVKGEQDNAREVMGAVEADPESYRSAARDALARKPVNVAVGHVAFERAEVQAAKLAERAVGKADWMEASKQKHRQLMNFYMAMESRDAKAKVDKAVETFARLNRKDEKFGKSIDIDYIYAARAILSKFGLARSSFDFDGWIEQLREEDPTAAGDLTLAIQTATARAQDYKKMPFEDFQGLVDTVENLLQVGRNAKTVERDGKRIAVEEAVNELIAQAAPLDSGARPGETSEVTEGEQLKTTFLGVMAALTRVEQWARTMDGGKVGAFTTFIAKPILTRVNVYRDAKKEPLTKLLAILDPRKKDLLSSGKIAAPELNYTFADKGELLHAISHTGNDSNMEKLLLGRNWGSRRADPTGRTPGALDTSRWDALVNRLAAEGVLTKADFDTAQALWDLNEELKGPAQAAHKAMYGYRFDEVTARPLQTPFGVYRGGYMPAIVDRNIVEDGQARLDAEALKQNQSGAMFPTTGRGFTRRRVDTYHRPLELNLMLIPSHIDKVLRFTHLEPAIKDVARVVNNKAFGEAMRGVDPTIISDMLVPWLQRTARQTVETPSQGVAGRALDKFSRAMRKRTGFQIMVGNFVNALQQVTGLSSAALKVSPGHLMRSLVTYAKAPRVTAREIGRKSAFMRNRIHAGSIELTQRIEEVLVRPTTLDQMRGLADRHGYVMQQGMQNVVDVITWLGAYEQATRAGMTDQDAVYEADSAVRTTQGSFAPEDLSRFETGAPFVRMFTMFYSYFNTQMNLVRGEATSILREAGWRKGAGQLFYVYLFGVLIPSVLAEIIVRSFRGDGDDEDEGLLETALEVFLGAQARYVAGMIPAVGPMATAALNSWNDKWYDDRLSTSPVVSSVESAARAPHSVYKAFADGGSIDRAVKDTLTLIGLMTGLPLGQLGKPVDWLIDEPNEK